MDGSNLTSLVVRRTFSIVEEKTIESGRRADVPLRKVAAVGVVENPFAGRYVENLGLLIDASAALGAMLSGMLTQAMAPYTAQSYGKAGLVGLDGEQEHANAVLTSVFANPVREALGGGKAWISSFTKRTAGGTPIDVPLASKDALYVRSHYDGMTLMLPDTPAPDEIAVIFCIANRGRLNARVGGIRHEELQGHDGLV